MSSENQELQQLLKKADYGPMFARPIDIPPQPTSPRTDIDFALWQVMPNGRYRPGSRTQETLQAGAYRIGVDDFGPYLIRMNIISDDIIELPEASHHRVLSGIRKFWSAKDRYVRHGLVYKRGVLLWGPPGGGKTVTAQLLMQDIVKQHDGIVLMAEQPGLVVSALTFLRMIEPTRPLIVVLEDIDEIIQHHGEHAILAMLDGENQTDNVVYITTTNYPERLGARIINRPSRFDERIKIGMPSPEARMVYLRKVCAGIDVPLERWCADTEGFSIAHIRELVVAVVCLDQEYEDVIDRLRSMEVQVKPMEGFRKNPVGLTITKVETAAQIGGGRR